MKLVRSGRSSSRFDSDPEALAWAREKIQRRIDHYRDWQTKTLASGNLVANRTWRIVATTMERDFIGAGGCVVGAFDERLPQFAQALALHQSSSDAASD